MPNDGPLNNTYLVVGGANTEEIVSLHRRLVQGEKHTATEVAEAVGGGAVNQIARLRAAGNTVWPILPLGEDATGPRWADALGEDCVRYADTKTSHTVICLDERQDRTVLGIHGTAEDAFADDVIVRVRRTVDALKNKSYALLLGHIRRDAAETSMQILKLAESAAVRMLFPGRSQFSYCYHHWRNLWLSIDYVQLELTEAREFVRRSLSCEECQQSLGRSADEIRQALSLDRLTARTTVESVLRFFQLTRMTAVVTFNHKGSAAVLRDDASKSVFIVFPYIVAGLKDPTGAGDAFGAGVARRAMDLRDKNKNPFTSEEFPGVLEHGTLWGALACCDYGGATNPPSANAIDDARAAWSPLHSTIQADIGDVGDWLGVFAD